MKGYSSGLRGKRIGKKTGGGKGEREKSWGGERGRRRD